MANRKFKRYPFYVKCFDYFGEYWIAAFQKMKDESRPISWATFKQHVVLEDVINLFPDYFWLGRNKKSEVGKLTLAMDYAVSFHRSKFFGQRCYYISHSAIEYVFTDGVDLKKLIHGGKNEN